MATLLAVFVSCEVIFSQIRLSVASTHWVVTEDGKVQSQVDSVFNMKRPYDLVAFMKQEERASMLDQLKQELLARKDEIDKTEDRDTGLEEKFYKSDLDCLAAGKHLPDLDLYISTVLPLENKGIRPEDYIPSSTSAAVYMPPDCTIYTSLPYSVHAFEHLEGMKDREKLTGTPELGLKNAITYQDNVDEYGHRIYEAFKQNKTSWVLYNMAAFYWRIKGDPHNVIECVRRALHYSPRLQKDVALISLANVLHRARYSNEAAVVVHAALDVSKELNVNHFTLGNIYAVLGEYNKSVICFENTLKIQPDFEAAAKRKHAVLCHAKLESALEQQHRSLQRTLNDLKDYQKKHDYWQQQNDKLLAEQVPMDVKVAQHVAYEELKLKEMSDDIGEYCKMGDKDGKQVLMCSWGKKIEPDLEFATRTDTVSPEQEEDKPYAVENKTEYIATPTEKVVDYSKPMGPPKYTEETVKVPRFQGTQEYLNKDWPSREECDEHVKKVPDATNLSSTYLSPENKGFVVKPLLSEAQGLKHMDEHPLPWYPPVCTTLLDIPEGNTKSHDDLESISYSQRTKIPLTLIDQWHTETLLNHVNDGKASIEEIGQRILTALKKNIGPKWILFNLAGLYWRIIGNNYHGVECFRRAIYTAPDKYWDVPETNMANILYRWGRYDDALQLATYARVGNEYEPATQFLLANILWAKKNYTGAAWRYQLALEADPYDKEILGTLRALKCYLKFYHSAQSQAPDADTKIYNNCPGGMGPNAVPNLGPQTESRVMCKTENGEEKCVIETRMRQRPGECDGSCSQTCTVTPMAKNEACGHGAQGPEGVRFQCPARIHHVKIIPPKAHGGRCIRCNRPPPNPKTGCVYDPTAEKTKLPGVNTAEDAMFQGDFTQKLDEIAEKYQKMGICTGEECNQLRVQNNGQMPHIKLDYVNGDIHQKLIFAQSPNEITVEPHECVIFNDGSKSSGCSRQEYRAYMEDYNVLKNKPEMLTLFLKDKLKRYVQVELQVDRKKKQPSVDLPKGPDTEPVKAPPFQGPILFADMRGQDGEVGDGIYQLPDEDLPDTKKYLSKRLHFPMPRSSDCQKMKKIDLKKFASSWLSLAAKKINVKNYIDFKSKPAKSQFGPVCNDLELPADLIIDSLPGLSNRGRLDYSAETGLRMVLKKAEGVSESIENAGDKIAAALKQNSTSWVAAKIASLYWRVKGRAQEALECLRVALTYAPDSAKDTIFISVANVLHRAGYINDAIMTMSYALQSSRDVVVSQFTMANLYAAKEQYNTAAMFYESTLGLQSDFQPAKDRLRTIQCMKVLQKPELYDHEDPNIQKHVIT